jgi:hypothetical protein
MLDRCYYTAQAMKKSTTKLAAAVELGRLGGLKGGKARKEKLSAKRRTQIARLAANARWAKEKENGKKG